jgi:hypothetical protein
MKTAEELAAAIAESRMREAAPALCAALEEMVEALEQENPLAWPDTLKHARKALREAGVKV